VVVAVLPRHDIELPIGLVNATACRTTPAPEITMGALGTDFYCIRRRLDGGFTLALRGRGTVEVSPDLFRYAKTFWPTYRQRRKGELSFGKSFFDQLMRGTSWSFDKPSPFETERVRDPDLICRWCFGARRVDRVESRVEGDRVRGGLGRHHRHHARHHSSDLQGRCAAGLFSRDRLQRSWLWHWAGAGKLAADLVTSDTPLVDPAAYSHTRLIDGRPLAPVSLF
jgi:hypothetical protein